MSAHPSWTFEQFKDYIARVYATYAAQYRYILLHEPRRGKKEWVLELARANGKVHALREQMMVLGLDVDEKELQDSYDLYARLREAAEKPIPGERNR